LKSFDLRLPAFFAGFGIKFVRTFSVFISNNQERKSMIAKVEISAGVCGFNTTARVESDDDQLVAFHIKSDCEKINVLAARIADSGALDAYAEISARDQSRLLALAQEQLSGCCAACAVPIGLFKAMQVAAGLALPREVVIRLEKEQA